MPKIQWTGLPPALRDHLFQLIFFLLKSNVPRMPKLWISYKVKPIAARRSAY